MEWWQWGPAAVALIGLVLTLGNRDRALQRQIADGKSDASKAIDAVKADLRSTLDHDSEAIHERIGRVQENYVRRDDLDGHLVRIEKVFDEIKSDQRRNHSDLAAELRDIKQLIVGGRNGMGAM